MKNGSRRSGPTGLTFSPRIALLGRGLDYAEQQVKVFTLANAPKPDRLRLVAALREREAVFQNIYDPDFFAVEYSRLLFKEQALAVLKAGPRTQ